MLLSKLAQILVITFCQIVICVICYISPSEAFHKSIIGSKGLCISSSVSLACEIKLSCCPVSFIGYLVIRVFTCGYLLWIPVALIGIQ